MGGDHGHEVIVSGAMIAAEYGVDVVLVGDPDKIGTDHGLPIIEASEVVPMGADPAWAVRTLRDSSIVRACEAVKDGRATAVLSAGSTGAAMAAALLRIGRIRGVSRPAVAVPFPVPGSTPCTLLDCGANPDCQPEWLVQFGQMGAAYMRRRYNLPRPRIGLLTIGEEAGKGNALIKETLKLFESTDWAGNSGAEFVGNIEANDMMTGVADVIVADGFTGNVLLKGIEGANDVIAATVRKAIAGNAALSGVSGAVEQTIAPEFDQRFNSRATGAAMLLGIRGVAMIAHGSSDSATIASATRHAAELVGSEIISEIRGVFST
jgi:glycerol-3-phosphate acyltransferase PlsX